METLKKWVLGIAIVLLGAISATSLVIQSKLKTLVVAQNQRIGTNFTVQASNSSYTDSADFRNNVQAAIERLASGNAYAVLQADSNGVMQRVAPSALASSPWTFSSTTRVASLVQTGAVTTYTTTSTVSASELCDSSVWVINAAAQPTLTLPSFASSSAACLTTNGDTRRISILNIGATNAIISAGTGGSLKWSLASTTINVGVQAQLVVFRTSSAGYNAALNLLPN